jgi:hypothetical protein
LLTGSSNLVEQSGDLGWEVGGHRQLFDIDCYAVLVVPLAMAIGTRVRGVFGVRHLDSDRAGWTNMTVLFERFQERQ